MAQNAPNRIFRLLGTIFRSCHQCIGNDPYIVIVHICLFQIRNQAVDHRLFRICPSLDLVAILIKGSLLFNIAAGIRRLNDQNRYISVLLLNSRDLCPDLFHGAFQIGIYFIGRREHENDIWRHSPCIVHTVCQDAVRNLFCILTVNNRMDIGKGNLPFLRLHRITYHMKGRCLGSQLIERQVINMKCHLIISRYGSCRYLKTVTAAVSDRCFPVKCITVQIDAIYHGAVVNVGSL